MADKAVNIMQERLAIRELIENWTLWRDAGEWDRFATVWHPEGRMWTREETGVMSAVWLAVKYRSERSALSL